MLLILPYYLNSDEYILFGKFILKKNKIVCTSKFLWISSGYSSDYRIGAYI